MPTLVGLFADQKKAEETVNLLSAAEIDDLEFETVESWEEEQQVVVGVVPTHLSGSGTAAVPALTNISPSWDLSDEEVEFFKRAVRKGGVLIAVSVPDEDQLPQISHILQQHSQKVAGTS